AVITLRVRGAAARLLRARCRTIADDEAVRAFISRHAQRAKTRDERRDPVAFLDTQLRRAADRHAAAVRGERRDRGQLVDQRRHLVRTYRDRLRAMVLDDDATAGLARV